MNEADIMQSDTSVRRCFEPGKLYRINRWLWFLFPTKETAVAAHAEACARDLRDYAAAVRARIAAASWASYWSKELNCNVSFLNETDTIMVVEVTSIQVKVINQEGQSGWINFPATQRWTKDTITEASNAP